jgi:hypothetical protein
VNGFPAVARTITVKRHCDVSRIRAPPRSPLRDNMFDKKVVAT